MKCPSERTSLCLLYFAIGALTTAVPFLTGAWSHIAAAIAGGLIAVRAYLDPRSPDPGKGGPADAGSNTNPTP